MKKKQSFISAVLLFTVLLLGSCSKEETITSSDSNLGENPREIEKSLERRGSRFGVGIVDKIEVICHFGHLHGRSFHANAQPQGSPLQRQQVLVLKKGSNNTWKQIRTNKTNELQQGKPFVAIGGESYAFEFIYYNRRGQRINSTFSNDSNVYQTLFHVDNYVDNKTNRSARTSRDGKSILSYRYRDTNPENKMYRRGGRLSYSKLGLKGYFKTKKSRIRFNLKVDLIKFRNANSKERYAIKNYTNSSNIAEKLTFELPINIVSQRAYTDEELETYYKECAKYFNLTPQRFEYLENQDVDYESSSYWM